MQLKKKMKLYTNDEMQYQIDSYIENGEGSAINQLETAENTSSEEIDINNLGGQV